MLLYSAKCNYIPARVYNIHIYIYILKGRNAVLAMEDMSCIVNSLRIAFGSLSCNIECA